MENEYFSKSVDVLSFMPNPAAQMITTLLKSEMDDRDKNRVLDKLNLLSKTITVGINEMNENTNSAKLELEGFHHYFAFIQVR
uniref:Uncharacterized protein n=1 Tax=Panagrolaimus sp. ES5 TaxID=591445 RepID=A0AC34FY67_9BILA